MLNLLQPHYRLIEHPLIIPLLLALLFMNYIPHPFIASKQLSSTMEPASLPTMPPELVQNVQSLLPYSSRLALRFTCRALYFKASRPKPGSKYEMSDLLEIETWPRYNHAAQRPQYLKQSIAGKDFFSCSGCLLIRSAIHFANPMMKGKRGKMSSVENKCGRVCIDCGIRQGKYRRGMSFDYGGAQILPEDAERKGWVCSYCGDFHSVNARC